MLKTTNALTVALFTPRLFACVWNIRLSCHKFPEPISQIQNTISDRFMTLAQGKYCTRLNQFIYKEWLRPIFSLSWYWKTISANLEHMETSVVCRATRLTQHKELAFRLYFQE